MRTITLVLQNPLFGYGVEYNEGRDIPNMHFVHCIIQVQN